MQRHEIINFLSNNDSTIYLEIGVDWGETFKQVNIKNKTGVDPAFKVDPLTLPGKCYTMYSDDFFDQNIQKYDIIFIDGLHTYQQSHRDLLNSIKFLNHNGVIIIDDCFPADEIAAISDVNASLKAREEAGQKGNMTWMGDVYKTVIWLNDNTDWSYAYIAENHNIAVAWPEKKSRERIAADDEDIENFSFDRFLRTKFPVLPIKEIRRRAKRG